MISISKWLPVTLIQSPDGKVSFVVVFCGQRCKNLIYNWDDAVSIMEFPLCQMTSEDSGSTALSRNLYTVHCGVAILGS